MRSAEFAVCRADRSRTTHKLMLRLYFNQHGDLPWSVDEGPGTPEQQFVSVEILICGETKYDVSQRGSANTVCAWIEYTGATLWAGEERTARIL